MNKIRPESLVLLILVLSLMFNFYLVSKLDLLKKENKTLELSENNYKCCYLDNLATLDTVVKENNLYKNHVWRMQKIAGVKNPDNVFTWKEKVINPINVK